MKLIFLSMLISYISYSQAAPAHSVSLFERGIICKAIEYRYPAFDWMSCRAHGEFYREGNIYWTRLSIENKKLVCTNQIVSNSSSKMPIAKNLQCN